MTFYSPSYPILLMTTNESYVKLTVNSDGKVQPELFIAGELDPNIVSSKLKSLIDTLESEAFKFKVVKNEVSHEVKQMSGWRQITVRGSDVTEVINKFNQLSNNDTYEIKTEVIDE